MVMMTAGRRPALPELRDVPTQLPTRLYHARTRRVVSLNGLEVDLSLNFGVSVVKHVILEGIDTRAVPAHRRSEAMHCLVLILGGRPLILHTDDSTFDGSVKARAYVDAPAAELPSEVTNVPFGLSDLYPDVFALYTYAAERGYSPDALKPFVRELPRS